MWRLLCLALLVEVSFGLILKTEKKPVILAHDKLKTDTEEKFLRTKEFFSPMIEGPREKVIKTPLVKREILKTPVVSRQIYRTGLFDDKVKIESAGYCHWIGLMVVFGLTALSLYRAVSQREGDRKEKW